MVHIFHNKETPLYKRFPDGWPTKAKWKTLPPPIPSHQRLNIITLKLFGVTRLERPKGVKDKVKQTRWAQSRSGVGGPGLGSRRAAQKLGPSPTGPYTSSGMWYINGIPTSLTNIFKENFHNNPLLLKVFIGNILVILDYERATHSACV